MNNRSHHDHHDHHDHTELLQDEPPAVDIINVEKSYYIDKMEVPILHGIDLAIQRGEFLAIMGPSGSGKSTLMNLIGCLDLPTGGEIHVSGKDVSKLSEAELAHLRGQEIGFVFQTFNLISRMSVLKNVELPTLANQKPGIDQGKRAKELIELVGLSNRMHHKPTGLSGGQRQRDAHRSAGRMVCCVGESCCGRRQV